MFKKKYLLILISLLIIALNGCGKSGTKETEINLNQNNQQSGDDKAEETNIRQKENVQEENDKVEDTASKDSEKKEDASNTENKNSTEATQVSTEANNPLIWADVPDPDVIRVDDYYYMVSTTMHLNPGVPVMRSKDLINWEIISYVYETLADDPKHNMMYGQNYYGKGSWAASIRYHEGTYYVCFASNELGKTFIFTTDNIENGTWTKNVLNGIFHDPSLYFEDGRVFIISGAGNIRITELTADATSVKPGGVNQTLVDTSTDAIVNCEGSHFYKIGDTYYLFLIQWPKTGTGRRIEWCYRSDSLLGNYEGKIVLDDNFFYGNAGVAQGGIVDTPEGDWYGIVFQDHGAVGRIPYLVPVTWTDGWPMMGVNGKVPLVISTEVNNNNANTIITNDEFDYTENKLKLQWQWNHNPDNSLWSVTERPGYLRLKTGNVVSDVLSARNSVSQRTYGPIFIGEVKLDTKGMKPGDVAGIAAFQNTYGKVGVKVADNGEKFIVVDWKEGAGIPTEVVSVPLTQDEVYLKIEFIFDLGLMKNLMQVDKAYFYYSLDGENWIKADFNLKMKYTLDHFMGYRIALFNYATKEAGGYADFDYFHYTTSLGSQK